MIVLVWLLSLLISIPPLLYPPWSIPYPSHAEIQVPVLYTMASKYFTINEKAPKGLLPVESAY